MADAPRDEDVLRVDHWREGHRVCAECPFIRQLVATLRTAVVWMTVLFVGIAGLWYSPRIYHRVGDHIRAYNFCVNTARDSETFGDFLRTRFRCNEKAIKTRGWKAVPE